MLHSNCRRRLCNQSRSSSRGKAHRLNTSCIFHSNPHIQTHIRSSRRHSNRSIRHIRYRYRSRSRTAHRLCSQCISHIRRRSSCSQSIFHHSPCRRFRHILDTHGIYPRKYSTPCRIHIPNTDHRPPHIRRNRRSDARCNSLRRPRLRSGHRCRISSRRIANCRRIRTPRRPHRRHARAQQRVTA